MIVTFYWNLWPCIVGNLSNPKWRINTLHWKLCQWPNKGILASTSTLNGMETQIRMHLFGNWISCISSMQQEGNLVWISISPCIGQNYLIWLVENISTQITETFRIGNPCGSQYKVCLALDGENRLKRMYQKLSIQGTFVASVWSSMILLHCSVCVLFHESIIHHCFITSNHHTTT